MSLTIVLLLAVVVTHYGYDPMCALFPSLEHAARGIFYVLRGIEGTVLFVVIGYLRPILWPVCLWGAAEEAETSVCRLASGPLGNPPVATPWSGLCGDLTQLPLYMLGIAYIAILVTRKGKR